MKGIPACRQARAAASRSAGRKCLPNRRSIRSLPLSAPKSMPAQPAFLIRVAVSASNGAGEQYAYQRILSPSPASIIARQMSRAWSRGTLNSGSQVCRQSMPWATRDRSSSTTRGGGRSRVRRPFATGSAQ